MTRTEEREGAHLDDLRRRLYRPDATEEDRRRYREELAGLAPEEAPPTGPAPGPQRRTALGIVAGVVVLVALVVAVRVTLPTASAPRPSPSATAPRGSDVLADVGDGDLLTLAAQRPSGPVPVAASIDGLSVAGQRFEGYGNAVVAFDPPEGAWSGGRVSVAVTSSRPGRVAWRSLLVVTRTDWSSYPVVLASGRAQDRSGAHAPTVFLYPHRPPTRMVVEAPDGVGWTLVVAATGSQAGVLH